MSNKNPRRGKCCSKCCACFSPSTGKLKSKMSYIFCNIKFCISSRRKSSISVVIITFLYGGASLQYSKLSYSSSNIIFCNIIFRSICNSICNSSKKRKKKSIKKRKRKSSNISLYILYII